jgi:hypothetical protein
MTEEYTNELDDELSGLYRQQHEALKSVAYIDMSRDGSRRYDHRAARINEIYGLAGSNR